MSLKEELKKAADERKGNEVAARLTKRTAAAAKRRREFAAWRDDAWLDSPECSTHPHVIVARDLLARAVVQTDKLGKRMVVAMFRDERMPTRDEPPFHQSIAGILRCTRAPEYVELTADTAFASIRVLTMLIDLTRHFTKEGLQADVRVEKWNGFGHDVLVVDPLALLRTNLAGHDEDECTARITGKPRSPIQPGFVVVW